MYDEKQLKDFDYWRMPRPSSDQHGTDSLSNPISSNLQSVRPRNWRQEGNLLKADTDWGPLVQTIPVDYLLDGTDERGLPKFKRVSYSNHKSAVRL
jgi:hypothetical protein